jgi:hypothetical protein
VGAGAGVAFLDGQRVEPGGDVWISCDICRSKLRFLIASRGRLVCRRCLAEETVREFRGGHT